VVFFVLLPAAVAVGVLVGHGSGRDDSKLLEALRHQTGIAGSSGGAALASASTRVASDFTLPHGFTVKLQLLPIGGTDQAAANAAKKAADAKGATKAGIIDPADFRTTPDQGKQGYVLYSGEFETRAKAQRELTRLRGKFKGAEVIAVASTSKAGKVLAKSQFGAIHQVAGFTASPQKIRHDAPIVRRIATQTGKDYIQAQRNLPDVITVGGDGSGGGPTTGGD
jgi:hypothetical protein